MTMSDEEWKKKLTAEQYYVLRQKGTERPGGALYEEIEHQGKGTYICAACGQVLFKSDTKFHSGSGWPSFYAPAEKGKVDQTRDLTHGMDRVEVTCSGCGGHLGHVFTDGPEPTGLRYCINGVCLKFSEEKPKQ
jgi:peptide-methionine (R)-S-oxide reductase